MKRLLLGSAGAVLALTSALAIAQNSPESLLPPGFEKPKARPAPAAPAPAPGATPVIQPLPGAAAPRAPTAPRTLPNGQRIPTLRELEAMSPDELDELLGLKPKYDVPPAARRSLQQVGVLGDGEGGFSARALAPQNPQLVARLLDGNRGQLVSRWGHILLRRALASRLDAPAGMNPADFAARRAALLVRMGEGPLARAIVQDVDAANYTPALIDAALDTFAFTADITGICPVIAVHGGARKAPDWRVLRAICTAFEGDGASGLAQLDRLAGPNGWQRNDILLAQKFAGSAGKVRRAVIVEWDGVEGMTPWRHALTLAVGLEPPAELMQGAARRYSLAAATAPMLSLQSRAAAADQAAGLGILSSAAMVDLYSQIYGQNDIEGDWAAAAEALRTAYVGETPAERMAAIRQLWDGPSDPVARYSRQVLTAYAAARMPVSEDFADEAPELIAAMLAAGLDRNALAWAPQADSGSQAWALLALAAANRAQPVDAGALYAFYDDDPSDGYRKSAFLLAGLYGLKRVDDATAQDFAGKLELDLARRSNWTRLIDQAADANNPALVALLAGVGMQGDGWDKMTPLYLYHIVSALNRVGLGAEARMIAAEALARG